MIRRRYTPPAVASLLAIALSACGGSSDSAAPSASDRVPAEGADAKPAERREGREGRERPGGGPPSRRAEEAGPNRDRGARRKRRLPRKAGREVALVHSLVGALIEGLNARDPSICTHLYDHRLLDASKRDEAVAECERKTTTRDTMLRLVRIEGVRLRRPEGRFEGALVQFVVRERRKRTRYALELLRTDSDYRINAARPTGRLE